MRSFWQVAAKPLPEKGHRIKAEHIDTLIVPRTDDIGRSGISTFWIGVNSVPLVSG